MSRQSYSTRFAV